MASSAGSVDVLPIDGGALVHRLLVCWQHPETRAIEPVGILSYRGQLYQFQYLVRAASVDGFPGLLGFDDLEGTYVAEELFPFFAQRVMDPRRPDYQRFITELSLSGEDSPWELLARTHGKREGDTVLVFPVPRADEHGWECSFLVHGVRHMTKKTVPVDGEQQGGYSADQLEALLASLKSGDVLELLPEPTNKWSDSAVLVLNSARLPIGYVPDLLGPAVCAALKAGHVQLSVERTNPQSAGWHLRLLVRLQVETRVPFDLLDDPSFQISGSPQLAD